MPLPSIAEIVLSALLGSPHFMAALVCGALSAVLADQSGADIVPLYAGLGGFAAYSFAAYVIYVIWKHFRNVR